MTKDNSVGTPYYVLLEDNQKLKPSVFSLSSGQECRAIYGFSDQVAYQVFIANSQRRLTPYPLVKTYLRSLLDSAAQSKSLVILDAKSEVETPIAAALVQSVFDAHHLKATTMSSEFELTFDPAANSYRVEEIEVPAESSFAFRRP